MASRKDVDCSFCKYVIARRGVESRMAAGSLCFTDRRIMIQNRINSTIHFTGIYGCFLLMLPLSLYLALPPTTTTLSIYCTSVTVFFIVIKMVNYHLHLMFDQGDIIAQNSVADISKCVDKKSNASNSCLPLVRVMKDLCQRRRSDSPLRMCSVPTLTSLPHSCRESRFLQPTGIMLRMINHLPL
ncbi:pecanex-like protein 3 isoform X1 [Carassius auratus]|uniref:Pecanex-like protein n=1 Tax=Carassius auratus TaxID=7957 RepID=A0A6P6QNA4_CARAU|nr:pecanex-like protein 3 isoform X1 [Carassius auratus]